MSHQKDTNFGMTDIQQVIQTIDESLYSRQLYVLGAEAMKRMARSSVFIGSVGGLGVEVAKNIILGGVKSVTLHDTKSVEWLDLSSNFYLSDKDIGKNRAESQINVLRELNPYVPVSLSTDPIGSLDYFRQFQVVVLTEGMQTCENVMDISDFCHQKGICFMLCETRGLFSRSFCDFGKEFMVQDPSGEDPAPIFIEEIVRDEGENSVTFTTTEAHKLQQGDSLRILKGTSDLEFLNDITIANSTKFTISTLEGFPDDLKTLHVMRVKRPSKVSFEKLSVSLEKPEFITPDWAKHNNPIQIHSLFRALDDFVQTTGRFPEAGNGEDFKTIYNSANVMLKASAPINNALPNKETSMDEKLTKAFVVGCKGQLCPMNAFIGGLVGQEVMKGCSGKLIPLQQWIFYESIESLPPSVWNFYDGDSSEFIGKDSRYEGQVAVFGEKFQQLLNEAKFFVVGAGAIGCELLKNFALMGVGCGDQGKITVTDMDSIEKSNLNRQFLFRDRDVGKQKSQTAAQAIRQINPKVNVEAHTLKVGKESEGVYDAKFFDSLDGIVTAVDNLNARMYMDEMCVLHLKPLLESGTHGTKGSTQIIYPGLTKNYGSTSDPATQEIPMCTLKYFPSAIQHTVQWARELFEELFKIPAENTKHFIQGTGIWSQGDVSLEDKFRLLKQVENLLVDVSSDYADCVTWAHRQFDFLFRQEIDNLLVCYPRDSLNAEDGKPFWSGGKLCPNPHFFNVEDTFCLDFVLCASNLKASLHGIPQSRDSETLKQLCSNLEEIPAVPSTGPAQVVEVREEDVVLLETTIRNMESFQRIAQSENSLEPLEFEKDDDKNLHIDFMTAASNLRAWNYGIPQADRLNVKKIAGRIIPAIATSTSVVAGLICLELYKVIWMSSEYFVKSPLKDCFLNLALPMIAFTSPTPPPKSFYNGKEYNVWSQLQVEGSKTLDEFIKWMKRQENLDVSSISYNEFALYDVCFDDNEPNMDLPLEEVARKFSGQEIGEKVKALKLIILCSNLGEKEEVPPVIYKFRS